MELYGLIGKQLSHSWSEKYFSQKFGKEHIPAKYQLFPLDSIELLPGLIERYPDLKGLNVTIPYKLSVIPFLTSVDREAKMAGSVNTIKIFRNEKGVILVGYNTDISGFRASLHKNIKSKKSLSALILGNGGVSRSVKHVLRGEGICCTTVTRTLKKNDQLSYETLSHRDMEDNLLIINTTPLGMFPDIQNCPEIPYQYLTKDHLLIDLIYNPELTLFLQKGLEKGAKVMNGAHMLEKQAEAAWKIWSKKGI
jgi:shikimate dehydrogenase